MELWPAYYGDEDRRYSPVYDYDQGPTPDLNYAHESGEPELLEYYGNESCAYYTDDSFATPLELNYYSVYTYSEPKLLHYDPSYNYYDPSETNYIQPKFLQYEPSPSDLCYFQSETKFTVSYSSVEFNEPKLEFNEPEFEEYDPTPYDGGYDPVAAYGKPLPPSTATCYPPKLPQSDNTFLEKFSYSSIPSPYVKDDPLPSPTPTPTPTPTTNKASPAGKDDILPVPTTKPPNEIGFENQNEKQVVEIQYSYGSGLEAIDLCESIFGYWPCLAKQARNKCQSCDQEIRAEPLDWNQQAADYLFGSPVVYDYQNYQYQ